MRIIKLCNLFDKITINTLLYKIAKSRIEEAKEKYNPRLVDIVSNMDPSGNQKYLNWTLKQHKKYPNYDIIYITGLVKDFHKNINNIENKDINNYSLFDLEAIINGIRNSKKPKFDKKSVDKIYEDNNFLLIQPKTKDAAIKYGKETKWCISGLEDNKFDEYHEKGLIYIIFDKWRQKQADGKSSKFAIFCNFDTLDGFRIYDNQDKFLETEDLVYYIGQEACDILIDKMLKDFTKKRNAIKNTGTY